MFKLYFYIIIIKDDTDEDTTFTLKDQKSISSSNSSIHSYNAAVVQKFDDPTTIPKNVDSIIISQNNGLDCAVNTSKHTSNINTKFTFKKKYTTCLSVIENICNIFN